MSKETLLELAARCEKADEADNVLNGAIARAVGWGYQTPFEGKRKNPAWFHPDDCRDGKPVFDSLHGTDVWREPAQYVFSIDAALQLVPEGWNVGQWSIIGKPDSCRIWGDEFDCLANAATPALALCAAALKARAQSEQNHDG